MLTFDSEKHEYRWNGAPVPGVTRIISSLTDYSRIDPDVLRRAQEEGKAIHKMVELEAKGELDLAALHADPEQAWMLPRYEAWCRFKDDTGFELVRSEEKLYHEIYGYAGTPDLFCLLPKLRIWSRWVVNLDLKRSLYAGPAIGLQTAAYTELHNRRVAKDKRASHRGALVLNDNGTYRLARFEDPDDWPAFLACLQQHRWRVKHGIAH